jgi:hypothetical protein
MTAFQVELAVGFVGLTLFLQWLNYYLAHRVT